MGGEDQTIRGAQNSGIFVGTNNQIICGGQEGTANVILGSEQSLIRRTGGGNVYRNAIIGGDSNTIINGQNNILIGTNNNCTVNNALRNIILGTSNDANNSGCFMFSDTAGGTQLSSVANNTFLVRCAGGSTFFTNNANSTGVTIGAGGGSWASVSDVNKKENLVELDCQDFMNKMEDLPIYQYNYIGNSKEQHCFGPTAQDWYKLFPTEKDQLTIETMDMIGVLMATVKNLNNRVKDLESKMGFM